MRTRNTRISAALLLVLVSLLLASIACYSGQIPGVLELTPFYTPTPLNVPEDSRFSDLEQVLAPQESGRTFFNLTTDPEPLQVSLVNSKSMCQGDSAAQVLFVGVDHNDDVYYLINCVGSVGWVAEDRLAGPLMFAKEDLALTITSDSMSQSIEMLDDSFRPLPFNPLQNCKPETVVSVSDIIAADPDGDDLKDVFYQIECPTTGGPLKGWVTNNDLFGPVPLNVGERALASAPESDFQMASEPAPVSDENLVETQCAAGDILVSEEVKLIDDTAYYRMTCGEDEGWVVGEQFVGPVKFDEGVNVVVYVPPVPVFADEIVAETAQDAGTEADAEPGTEPGTEPAAEETVAVDGTQRASSQGREVVEITPPLYLTNSPAPAVLGGDEANVVAECSSGMVAFINDYAAADTIYYDVACDECTIDEDGELVCEELNGWADQQYLHGPVDFVIGQPVTFKDSSSAVETDEAGVTWARIPPNIESAGTIGSYTKFAGRCLYDDGLEITGIVLEKDRTRNQFSFFYAVQCTGQSSTITEEKDGNIVRPKVEYNDDETLITGYASGRDLVALDE